MTLWTLDNHQSRLSHNLSIPTTQTMVGFHNLIPSESLITCCLCRFRQKFSLIYNVYQYLPPQPLALLHFSQTYQPTLPVELITGRPLRCRAPVTCRLIVSHMSKITIQSNFPSTYLLTLIPIYPHDEWLKCFHMHNKLSAKN